MKKIFCLLSIGIFINTANANAQVDTNTASKDSAIISTQITEAVFPGGLGAWYRFLSNNINSYMPTDKGAKPGSYIVKVQFLIDTLEK
jgi:hypothetical protein